VTVSTVLEVLTLHFPNEMTLSDTNKTSLLSKIKKKKCRESLGKKIHKLVRICSNMQTKAVFHYSEPRPLHLIKLIN